MVWSNGRTSAGTRGLVGLVLWFSIITSLWAQYGDPVENRAIVGRDFSVVIQSEIPYSYGLKASVEGLPQGVRISAGPSIRAYRRESLTEGRTEYQTLAEIRYSLRAASAGIYLVPGAVLEWEGQSFQLEPFHFMAFRWDEWSRTYPLNVEWRDTNLQIYRGETLPLVLEARYTESILFPDAVELHSPQGAVLERVSLPGDIESLDLGQERVVYGYPLESWIFRALEPGTLTIPSGQVEIEGLGRAVPPLTLEVLELPQEIQGSGAIGRFRWHLDIPQESLRLGESVNISLTVEGQGNFPSIQIPDPELNGFELISRQDSMDILPHVEYGYIGAKTYEFNFFSLDSGIARIDFPGLFYFDKDRQAVQQLEPLSAQIEVLAFEEQRDRMEFLPFSYEEVISNKDWFQPDNWQVYLLVLPFLLSPLLLLKKKKKLPLATALVSVLLFSGSAQADISDLNLFQEAALAFDEGDYQSAIEYYERLEEGWAENSAFLYNLSLFYWHGEDPGEAQWYLRKALAIRPGHGLYSRTLEYFDESMEQQIQYSGSLLWKQNWFFGAGLLSLALLFAVTTLYFLGRKTRDLLYLILAISFALLTWGAYGYISLQNRITQVVVMDDQIPLRKISGELARDWIFLEEGTALQVQNRYADYYFVRTGYGLEGWVSRDAVRPLQEVSHGF